MVGFPFHWNMWNTGLYHYRAKNPIIGSRQDDEYLGDCRESGRRIHGILNGWTAHSGIIRAFLAREGFADPNAVLERKFGSLHAYSPRSNPARILEYWGNPYKVMEPNIKPHHSCCRYNLNFARVGGFHMQGT